MPGFVLLINPDLWPLEDEDVAEWESTIAALERGEPKVVRWSTGSRWSGISEGDPVVLMQTGAQGGIVTIGTAHSTIAPDTHWDGSEREAPYVKAEFVDWAGDDPLPRDVLRAELPHKKWPPQTSGVMLSDEDMDRALELWGEHVGRPPRETPSGRGRRAQTDAVHNRAVELRAMAKTREAMKQLGWSDIVDTSATEPFDFEATSPEGRIRVEVKGLSTQGQEVELTHNEVQSARGHLTALAVVRMIEVVRKPDGSVVGKGGKLTWENPWDPTAERLEATRFRYRLT